MLIIAVDGHPTKVLRKAEIIIKIAGIETN